MKNHFQQQRKEPWQIAAARYCVKNSEKGFTEQELKNHIQDIYSVSNGHFNQFVEEELQLPSGRKFSRSGRDGYWIPPLELVSKVTDYDELREARKSAQRASCLSIVAIIITSLSLLVQVLVSAQYQIHCGGRDSRGNQIYRYSNCSRSFWLGLFGVSYKISDFTEEQK